MSSTTSLSERVLDATPRVHWKTSIRLQENRRTTANLASQKSGHISLTYVLNMQHGNFSNNHDKLGLLTQLVSNEMKENHIYIVFTGCPLFRVTQYNGHSVDLLLNTSSQGDDSNRYLGHTVGIPSSLKPST